MNIYIKDIIASGAHGCFSYEKKQVQRFRVSIDIELLSEPKNDILKETVDWSKIRDIVMQSVQEESFSLVETLAQHIAQLICERDAHIKKMRIYIEKLDTWDNGVPSVSFEVENGKS